MATGVPIAVTSIVFPPDDTYQGGTMKIGTFDEPNETNTIYNTFVGQGAGKNFALSETGISNIFIGTAAGYGATGATGFSNVCIGVSAGTKINSSTGNIFIGNNSGAFASDAFRNVYVGSGTGYENETSSDNVFIGNNSGNASHSSESTYVGSRAGRYTFGDRNVYIGTRAGISNPGADAGTGSSNVCCGWESGKSLTSGNSNIFIGDSSGVNFSTGDLNIAIGNGATFANGVTGSIAIGNTIEVAQSNTAQFGDSGLQVVQFGTTNTTCYARSFVNTSDRNLKENFAENVVGLEFIEKLNPVSYNYKSNPEERCTGLVAQDVKDAADQVGFVDFQGVKPIPSENGEGLLFIDYNQLIPSLIKSIQELSAEVKRLKNGA